MTEKQYGGATGRGNESSDISKNAPKKIHKPLNKNPHLTKKSQRRNLAEPVSEQENPGEVGFEANKSKQNNTNLTDKQKILKAGKLASQVREFAKTIIKKNISLLEIAEKIEDKITGLGGKPAFPVNLSINEIAAHYTPSYNDEIKANGLLKVDFGIHIDGWIADTAFSVDLEESETNKKLIEAAKEALENAGKIIKMGTMTREIGKEIQKAIESNGFFPIINLSGHEIGNYDLHAGLTIPNINDKTENAIKKGIYAIEPFATNGFGKVRDGKPSGIYMLVNAKSPRSPLAREILNYIAEKYHTLPFCSRWLVKKFETKALVGLRELEQNGNLHHYPQLIEAGNGIVSQAEHTFLVEEGKVIITTE